MKLKLPDEFCGVIVDASGVVCQPRNGFVVIPDHLVHAGLWAQGFVRVEDAPKKAAQKNG